MCNFFSCIIVRGKGMRFSGFDEQNNHSHEICIRALKLRDDGRDKKFVRIECKEGKNIRIDESMIPDWLDIDKYAPRIRKLYKILAPIRKTYDEA